MHIQASVPVPLRGRPLFRSSKAYVQEARLPQQDLTRELLFNLSSSAESSDLTFHPSSGPAVLLMELVLKRLKSVEASRTPGRLWPEGPLVRLKCDTPPIAQVGEAGTDRAEDWFAMEPWILQGKAEGQGRGHLQARPPGEAVSLPSWRGPASHPAPLHSITSMLRVGPIIGGHLRLGVRGREEDAWAQALVPLSSLR